MNLEHDGVAAGVTNVGRILVCINSESTCMTAELDIKAAELFAKTLLLAIDAAKQMEKKE